MRLALFALLVIAPIASPATAQLGEIVGDWSIHDASGAQIGSSLVVAQAPDAMLFERRRVGESEPQPLWFAFTERRAWVQYFVGASGRIREFRQVSAPRQWPVIMTGDVVLRDGRAATFRMTINRVSPNEMRRLLEMTTDRGANWSTIFDYRYRRASPSGQ